MSCFGGRNSKFVAFLGPGGGKCHLCSLPLSNACSIVRTNKKFSVTEFSYLLLWHIVEYATYNRNVIFATVAHSQVSNTRASSCGIAMFDRDSVTVTFNE
jgi:hypothetical protein